MKSHTGSGRALWTIIVALCLSLALAQAAFAAALTVRVQPSGDTFANAYVITGEGRTYFGNVEGGTGPYEYRWEFSNGGDTAFMWVANSDYIAYDGKVFDAAGTQWARLTVRDSGSPQQTASATINLQVIAAANDDLNRKKNSAIDRGLRYLYTQQNKSDAGSSWPGSGAPFGSTGMALIALENHGHNLQSPDNDIYKKPVQQGVRYLLNNAKYHLLSDQQCIGNPEADDGDNNNNGKGVYFHGVGQFYEMYIDPIVMLALVNSCDQATARSYVANTISGDVNGQTLYDIVVDAKDYLAWAQNDGGASQLNFGSTNWDYYNYGYLNISGSTVSDIYGYLAVPWGGSIGYGGTFTIAWGDGTSSTYVDQGYYAGWGYAELSVYDSTGPTHTYAAPGTYNINISYSSNGTTIPVMAASVTAAAGVCGAKEAAQGAGGWRYYSNYGSSDNSVTQWPVLALAEAKNRWKIDVNSKVKTMLDYWLQYSQNDGGGFGYDGPWYWYNFPKTAAGTIMLNYLGLPESNSRVSNAFAWLDANWYSENFDNLYSMYALYKGMKSYNKKDLNGRNWEELYTDYLVNAQQWWNGWYDNAWEDQNFATYSALAILAPEIASLPPMANAGGPYQDVNPGQNVKLDGSKSYHKDPARSLVKWEWDFDASDGLWWTSKAVPAPGEGAVGLTANASYPDAGMDTSHTVTLRVTDDTAPNALTSTATATVKVTTGNVAPVATTNGPWAALPGQPVTFDGSKSTDPNAGAPLYDGIVSYEWDLDGDGLFNEPNGDDGTAVTPDHSVVTKTFTNPVSLPATLRVTDKFGKVGISTATTNIISIAVVYGSNYETCYRTAIDRYKERQGLKVTFKNQGNSAADNLKMALTSTPSNLLISNNKSISLLGSLAPGQAKSTACDATAKTADIEVIFDRRVIPTGEWRWRSEFDFGNGHYIVDNIPPLAP